MKNSGKQSNRIEVVMFKIELRMPAFAAKYKLIVIDHSCTVSQKYVVRKFQTIVKDYSKSL